MESSPDWTHDGQSNKQLNKANAAELQLLSFFFHVFIFFSKIFTTLPTMQFQNVSPRYKCVILVAANVASSC